MLFARYGYVVKYTMLDNTTKNITTMISNSEDLILSSILEFRKDFKIFISMVFETYLRTS